MEFKQFLLNEQRAYLGQKVGDVLTSTHELRDDSEHMSSRDLIRFSQIIVNQIRRIIHSNWPREEKKHLKTLQKVAVALMKSIDEKSDLPGTISGVASALEKLVTDLGVPINKLGAVDKANDHNEKAVSEPEKQIKTQEPQIKTQEPQSDIMQQVSPPGEPLELNTPSLGGSSGPMTAF